LKEGALGSGDSKKFIKEMSERYLYILLKLLIAMGEDLYQRARDI
tara:strand:- start:377 stop:511 length:135 start_codon:yes stop_codon:yes gene_type:complete